MTASSSALRHPERLLVTGGCGFIGSAFIQQRLADPGFAGRIVNLDALTYAGNPANLSQYAEDPRYRLVVGNIEDQSGVHKLLVDERIDTLVHFAAESHVDRSILGPLDFVRTNVLGTATLLEAVRSQPQLHFHHVSTDEVFGSLASTGAFREDTPYDPRSPYSASKAASDHLVRAWAHTYGLSVTVSNCSNNYGPRQFPEKLLPLMLLNMLSGKPLPVYGDGLNIRDWLYVDDHAEAIWRVLTHGVAGETYNIGGRAELTNLELLRRLIAVTAEQTGRSKSEFEALMTFVPDRAGHDRRYAIDCGRIERELGWAPRFTLESGLALTVAWYLSHPEWVAGVLSGSYRDWVKLQYSDKSPT